MGLACLVLGHCDGASKEHQKAQNNQGITEQDSIYNGIPLPALISQFFVRCLYRMRYPHDRHRTGSRALIVLMRLQSETTQSTANTMFPTWPYRGRSLSCRSKHSIEEVGTKSHCRRRSQADQVHPRPQVLLQRMQPLLRLMLLPLPLRRPCLAQECGKLTQQNRAMPKKHSLGAAKGLPSSRGLHVRAFSMSILELLAATATAFAANKRLQRNHGFRGCTAPQSQLATIQCRNGTRM